MNDTEAIAADTLIRWAAALATETGQPVSNAQATTAARTLAHWARRRRGAGLARDDVPDLRRNPVPEEVEELVLELCQSQPTEYAADLGQRLALAMHDWLYEDGPGE